MERRTIDFHSSDEVIADIARLRQQGYDQTGKWNLTQICEHLSATMRGGMEGFGFRMPWVLRATMIEWGFRYLLRRRKLFAGAPTFKSLKPSADAVADQDSVIDDCIEICRKVADFQGPIVDYPLLNDVSVQDWRDFMWIHAAHHLSFLVPKLDDDAKSAAAS